MSQDARAETLTPHSLSQARETEEKQMVGAEQLGCEVLDVLLEE